MNVHACACMCTSTCIYIDLMDIMDIIFMDLHVYMNVYVYVYVHACVYDMHVSQCILWPHPAHQYEGTLAQLPRRLLLKINTQDTPMMAS